MRARHIAGGLIATLSIPATVAPVAAQPSPRPPDAADVAAAYLTVRGWLEAYELPDPAAMEARLPMAEASGVCLILRHRGRVLGVGADATGDDLMVRRAAGLAFGAALGHPVVAALPGELRDSAGASMTLEMEVGGPPLPLPGRDPAALERMVEPGITALALRRGDDLAVIFPAQLLAIDRADRLVGQLALAADGLGLEVRDPARLLRRPDLSVYALATVHLAQSRPGGAPFTTIRGQRLVPPDAADEVRIAGAADELARHVIRSLPHRVPPGEPELALGVLGTYHEVADRSDPLLAPPLEQALLALALIRYAAAPGVDRATAAEAAELARELLIELATIESGESNPIAHTADASAAILAILADETTLAHPGVEKLLAAAVVRLLPAANGETSTSRANGETSTSREPGEHGEHHQEETSTSTDPHELALKAAALAALLRGGLADLQADTVRAAIDEAWNSGSRWDDVARLPWIAWAEWNAAAATGTEPGNVNRLEELLGLLEASRIGTAGQPGPADLRGGFVLTSAGARRTSAPRADAQSLRPAVFVAWAARQPELESGRPGTTALCSTARFIRQLQVRPEELWAVRNAERARGGLRGATWERRQPTAVQAMGLLALAETLWSLPKR